MVKTVEPLFDFRIKGDNDEKSEEQTKRLSYRYRYFISYSYVDFGKSGFGNFEHCRDEKISSIDDIIEIAKMQEKELNFKEGTLSIISYQLFD